MPQEEIIWETIVFATALLLAMATVIVSFVFMYQRKRERHQREMMQAKETFEHEMLHSKAEIQEQTLRHIAAEIHDNFSPTLSVINLNLAGVIPLIQDPAKATIVDSKILLRQLMAEMRALSSSLNANHVSHIGFDRALEKYIEQLTKTGLYQIEFSKVGKEYRLTPNQEIILLRMCQEIINNIVKHANAKCILIRITYGETQYKIEINDDGIGFDLDATLSDPNKQDCSGILNLRNRAVVINGELTIQSAPGKGTKITIAINQ